MTADVLRWHSNPDPRLRNSGDTVAAHQLRVADLCHSLAARIGHPLVGSDLIKAALHHDDAEQITGDWPAPLMDSYPWVRIVKRVLEWLIMRRMGLHWRLTRKEAAMLHLCDKLDAAKWRIKQRADVADGWDLDMVRLICMASNLGATNWLHEQLDAVRIAPAPAAHAFPARRKPTLGGGVDL